jgi:hypothetical protein
MSAGIRSAARGMLAGGLVLAVLLTAPGMSSAKPKPITPTPQVTGPAAFSASRTATLRFADSRTDATFTCRLDAAPARACTSPVTYQNLAEGSHTFRVRAKSPTLRQSNEASLTWTVDVTRPAQPTVTSPSSPTSSATVTVRFSSASNDVDHYLCSLDEATAVACSSPQSVIAAAEGLHTYAVTAVDRAGNTSTAGTGFWYRDSLTPVPVVNDGPSDPTTSTGATFTFASSEGGVSFGCSLDGSPFTACTTGKVYGSLGLGTHTFKVRSTDGSGNTADSAIYTWHVVATLAVNLTWVNQAALPAANTSATTGTFAYTTTGATTVACTLDAAPVAGCGAVSAPTVTGLANGVHSFTVTADAGLPNQIALRHGWTVDTVAPRAPVVLGPSGLVASTSATLTVLPSALGDAVSCTLDGAAASCTSPVALTGLGQGTHTYRVTESDLAGNTASASISWTVDTTPPVVTVTGSATLSGPVRLAMNEAVTGLTTSSVLLRLVGGAAIPSALACADAAKVAVACDATSVRSATLIPATALVPGQHYEVVVNAAGAVTVTDVAGNPAATKTTAFRGALLNQESSAASSYRWKRVASTKALGGSYVVEHRAGATAAWTFTGTAVTWITATGPRSGRAQVWVDGVKKRAVNNYAAGAHWKVARSISGLSANAHTVKIVVLGRKGAKGATDTQVVVDGFKVGTTTTASPSLRLTWPRGTSTKASGGAFVRDDLAGASATFRFRGTGVTWVSATGPTFGKAAVFIDGKRVRRVDSWSATAKFKVARSFTGLTDTVHTIRVKVLGTHRTASSGNQVVVDGWRVA